MPTPTPTPDPQTMLLKQQVFHLTHQLTLTLTQNENMVSQIAQLKEKSLKLKQLNDMLVANLTANEKQITDEITLKIDGEFLTKRVKQLEEELQKYRSGVSDSVDRRVKRIVDQYTQEKEVEYEKRKSRLSLGNNQNSKRGENIKQQPPQPPKYYQTHQHKYYNIEYNTYTEPSSRQESICQPYEVNAISNNNSGTDNRIICEKCLEFQEVISEKDQIIEKLQDKLRSLSMMRKGSKQHEEISSQSEASSASTEEWKMKYLQLMKHYENLKDDYDLALSQIDSLSLSSRQQQQHMNHNGNSKKDDSQSYTITQSPINGFKKKQVFQVNPNPNSNGGPRNSNPCQSRLYKEQRQRDRQQEMLQQITNLANGYSRSKNHQNQKQQKGNCQQFSRIEQYQQQQFLQQQNNRSYIQDKKSRVSYAGGGSSRLSHQPAKLDGSVFTIKQGVNRHGNSNALF